MTDQPRRDGARRNTESELDRTGPKTSHRYASPHLPELVGIVGEMHALRFLKSRFGIDERAWVSEFRNKALPSQHGEWDETSDSHGYDFRFVSGGTTWCIEVKSTNGNGTTFDLSPGEVRAAMRIARFKDERWRILRVRRAFDTNPVCDWLPNPFEPGADQRVRLQSSGTKVEYTLPETTATESEG